MRKGSPADLTGEGWFLTGVKDPGLSEVNQLNRIKLMLSVSFRNAQQNMAEQTLDCGVEAGDEAAADADSLNRRA